MNRYIVMMSVMLIGVTFISCEQILNVDRESLFETGFIKDLNDRSATIEGLIISIENDVEVTQHGHCWAQHENPTIEDDSSSTLGPVTGTGNFTSTIEELDPNSQYFVRAYIVTNGNVRYDRTLNFATVIDQNLPTVSTLTVFNIDPGNGSAQVRSRITNPGTNHVTSYGHLWSTSVETPELDTQGVQSDINQGAPAGNSFVSSLNGLTAGNTYYVRSFVVSEDDAGNSVESYGNVQAFSLD